MSVGIGKGIVRTCSTSLLAAATHTPVRERRTGALIHVLGTNHTLSRSVDDVTALCDKVGKDMNLVGIAVELDPDTASYHPRVVRALRSHTLEQIKNNGVRIVQQEMFLSPFIHKQAAAAMGKGLSNSNQITVPPMLKQHLQRGVIWAEEMAVAVEYANRHKLAIAFVDQPPSVRATNRTPIPALERLTGALIPAGILRQRKWRKYLQPTTWEMKIASRDRFMANSIAKMCVDQKFGAEDHVVVVVGATHVPGVCETLADDDDVALNGEELDGRALKVNYFNYSLPSGKPVWDGVVRDTRTNGKGKGKAKGKGKGKGKSKGR